MLARALRASRGATTGRRFLSMRPRTMYDKIWDEHVVEAGSDGNALLYSKALWRLFKDVASFIEEEQSRTQVLALEANVEAFNLAYFGMGDKRQGVVHIIGPEQGFTVPGATTVCGDSHTATHGAFGALAFGIGTSEQQKMKNFLIRVDGALPVGVTAKDVILHFAGEAIRSLSMEGRMSICNMAIEAGARAGLIAPDDVTFDYLRGRPMVPAPESDEWGAAAYDRTVVIDAASIAPTVTWGTSPEDTAPISGRPSRACEAGEAGGEWRSGAAGRP
ncbi:3-isopropylmalate dehydratase [Emiliania huxleyi CCMP1516]|uniref:3-isopropylmalate dehydratase n=2 Tax=Emiliania huxleyi TaxID=2903 RepID=A0A0D3KE00_EMIH1|nr:3-isopropylmalate dehydratase [Emiliania huxleyi CCMP1516]EOD33985.1 3-isopropylmalate dehydratase [Emiliania huxleyi CCMP1516]|eukprot:XP_005786414.1 3-isopropylmalate dehydratase [Emiliania huxleyi CCMP1516]